MDDPYEIKALQVHLVPFYMDMSRANLLSMGWEVWATCDIKKRFRLMTSFRKSYLEINKPEEGVTDPNVMHLKNKLATPFKFEAMGQFNFADYTRNRRVKIILEQYSSGYGNYRTTHTKYLMVPGTVRKSFGLRGGFYNLYTPFDLSETKGMVSGEKAFYGMQANRIDTIKNISGWTSMNSMVLAVGLDMRTITNVVINTDTYGTRSNRLSSNIYLDALLAVYNNYKDFYVGTGDTLVNIKPYAKRPLGWRFGWQYVNPVKPWMSMTMEFGKRPEWKSNSASGFFF
ncbi:MAG: hypothetical protein HYZ42_12425, partial [Bacteroidetes bacterium]|nr:hypothetical protein [Bacteroidota bacterium]